MATKYLSRNMSCRTRKESPASVMSTGLYKIM